MRCFAITLAGAAVCGALVSFRPTVDAGVLDDGEALALVAAWSTACLVAGWYGLGVLACTAARVWPYRRMLRHAVAWSPPAVRRLSGIAACSIAGTSALMSSAPAFAVPDDPVVRTPPAITSTTTTPTATPALPAVVTAEIPTTASHVVTRGENLWRIATAELTRVTGNARPGDHEVLPYWRAVLAANRSTLRSGDPDLIYPGEVVTLPPVG
jgi:hypothetical protein